VCASRYYFGHLSGRNTNTDYFILSLTSPQDHYGRKVILGLGLILGCFVPFFFFPVFATKNVAMILSLLFGAGGTVIRRPSRVTDLWCRRCVDRCGLCRGGRYHSSAESSSSIRSLVSLWRAGPSGCRSRRSVPCAALPTELGTGNSFLFSSRVLSRLSLSSGHISLLFCWCQMFFCSRTLLKRTPPTFPLRSRCKR
jgi:hypothetical protein